MSGSVSWFSNPVWQLRNSLLSGGEITPGALWTFNQDGFASPSGARAQSQSELAAMNQYNAERSNLTALERASVDNIMETLFPTADAMFGGDNSAALTSMNKQLNWLADHENGSEFYSDPANYEYGSAEDPDWEADLRMMMLTQIFNDLHLVFVMAPLVDKVMGGVASPIVIDLNGDGIQTTSLLGQGAVSFDIDGDGLKDKTAWVSGADDAFLAVDKDGDGLIGGVSELFGGLQRGDGFAKLAAYDSNEDGVVDKNDSDFAKLLLWTDSNMNGVTDAGELRSAAEAGLQSISTSYISQDIRSNGNLFGEASTAVVNGATVDAIDIYFRYQNSGADKVKISALPNAQSAVLVDAMAGFGASNSDFSREMGGSLDISQLRESVYTLAVNG